MMNLRGWFTTANASIRVSFKNLDSQVIPRLGSDVGVVGFTPGNSLLIRSFTSFRFRHPIVSTSGSSTRTDTLANNIAHVQKHRRELPVINTGQWRSKQRVKFFTAHHNRRHKKHFLTSVQIRLNAPVPTAMVENGDFLSFGRVTDETHSGNFDGVIQSNSSRLDAVLADGSRESFLRTSILSANILPVLLPHCPQQAAQPSLPPSPR